MPHIYQSSALPFSLDSQTETIAHHSHAPDSNTQLAFSTYIFHKYLKPDLPKTELIIILSKLGHYPEFSIPAIPLASTHLLKPETWGFSLTLLQHSWITAAVAIFHYMAWETKKAGLK